MIDRNKSYTLKELLELYSLYNLEFKYYGNNKNGELELYLKTGTNKVSVFKSLNNQTKLDYLSLDENEARKIKMKFDREVDDLELDIVAIVIRTSDVNIPATKYTLKTLDKLTREQDLETRPASDLQDGIAYIIVDQSSACTLYDNVYLFDKDNGGLINSLEKEYLNENDSLIKNNLKMILDYYNDLTKEDCFSR